MLTKSPFLRNTAGDDTCSLMIFTCRSLKVEGVALDAEFPDLDLDLLGSITLGFLDPDPGDNLLQIEILPNLQHCYVNKLITQVLRMHIFSLWFIVNYIYILLVWCIKKIAFIKNLCRPGKIQISRDRRGIREFGS
jgi:hypothetical protein